MTAFYFGHVLADFVWFTAVAAAVGAGRRVMSDGALRRLVQACGVLMLLFGLYFMARGVFSPEKLTAERRGAAREARCPEAVASGRGQAAVCSSPGDMLCDDRVEGVPLVLRHDVRARIAVKCLKAGHRVAACGSARTGRPGPAFAAEAAASAE